MSRVGLLLMVLSLAMAVLGACGEGASEPGDIAPSQSPESQQDAPCQRLVDGNAGGDESVLVFGGYLPVARVKDWQLSRGLGERVAMPLLEMDDAALVEVCAFHGDFSSVPSPGPGREWTPPNAAYLFVFEDGEVWLDLATSIEELPAPPELIAGG